MGLQNAPSSQFSAVQHWPTFGCDNQVRAATTKMILGPPHPYRRLYCKIRPRRTLTDYVVLGRTFTQITLNPHAFGVARIYLIARRAFPKSGKKNQCGTCRIGFRLTPNISSQWAIRSRLRIVHESCTNLRTYRTFHMFSQCAVLCYLPAATDSLYVGRNQGRQRQ